MGSFKNFLLKLKHELLGYKPPEKLKVSVAIDTQSPFNTCASFTANEEGGYSGDMQDNGNWTSGVAYKGVFIGSKFGVSAPTALRYFGSGFTKEQMQGLSVKDFEVVFKGEVWVPAKADCMPTSLSLMVCDHAYNRGLVTSIRILQNTVNTKADGLMGPNTLIAVASFVKNNSLDVLLSVLYKNQFFDYTNLKEPRYERGWLNRCLARYTMAKTLIKKEAVNV